MIVQHHIVACKPKKKSIERICDKMGKENFRFRGDFDSRFFYFFMRHYLIFTRCTEEPETDKAGISFEKNHSIRIPRNLPKGSEYWGTLEETFKTEKNKKAAKRIGLSAYVLRFITVIASFVFLLATFAASLPIVLHNDGYLTNDLIMPIVTSIPFLFFLIGLIFIGDSLRKFQGDKLYRRAKHAKILLILFFIACISASFSAFLAIIYHLEANNVSPHAQTICMVSLISLIFVLCILLLICAIRTSTLLSAAKFYALQTNAGRIPLKNFRFSEYNYKLLQYREYLRYQKLYKKHPEYFTY